MSGEPTQEMQVGDGLFVMMLKIAELKERDLNAQIVQPRHMERLAENIRQRGQIESLPYVHWPLRQGPKIIVSGHHRSRAARDAGLEEIPCLVDTMPMSESQITAKQVAHNEIHGKPDMDVLAQMLAQIDNVDDLLHTGLPEDMLPVPGKNDTSLGLPHAEFDWKLVTLLFLPRQLAQFESALDTLDKKSELIGIAAREDFEEFSRTVVEYGRTMNIRSVATSVHAIVAIATREIELADTDGAQAGSDWVRTADLFGPAVPPDAAAVIRQAVAVCLADGDIPPEQRWRACEYLAAEFLAAGGGA